MSSEKSPSKDGFVQSVLSFFKKISLKAKLIMGMILGFATVVIIFITRKGINNRKILELELKKIRTELEIELVQKDIDINQEKIDELESRELEIRKQLDDLDKLEARDEVSREELDEFFDDRGF